MSHQDSEEGDTNIQVQRQRKRLQYSDSESDNESNCDEEVKRVRLCLKKSSEESDLFSGGLTVISSSKSGGSSVGSSMTAAAKKGQKEVEELERELDLKNTFSKETNRRDEDAEMSKYIEEQMRLRREAQKSDKELQEQNTTRQDREGHVDLSDIFNSANGCGNLDDILLHTLSKNFASRSDEKSESMLSNQMLTGIPEVDLGLSERIRTIEATEEAKMKLAVKFDKVPAKGRATDDYYLSKFKRNMQNR